MNGTVTTGWPAAATEGSLARRGLRTSGPSAGFTLIEATTAMAIMAVAGSVLVLAVESSLRATSDATEQTIAAGVSRQVLDEILGLPYTAIRIGSQQYPLVSQATAGRMQPANLGNDEGSPARGLVDISDEPPGQHHADRSLRHPNFRLRPGFFRRWEVRVEVYNVAEDDHSRRLSASQASDYRAVEMFIEKVRMVRSASWLT